MIARQRIADQPAWLLHHRPFRDSSRILDILSRDHGRLSLVARGSRRAGSRLKGILRPFLPLRMSWVARSDLGTLTGAEINGAPISLAGEALLSGYYINELLLSFLHRHDAQPEIFEAYGSVIRELNADANVAAVLRRFEIDLLRLLGYALVLDHDTESGRDLEPDGHYEYRVLQGPVVTDGKPGPLRFLGAELLAVGQFRFDDPATVRAAGRLLRHVVAWHLDGRELKSRKVLIALKNGLAGDRQE